MPEQPAQSVLPPPSATSHVTCLVCGYDLGGVPAAAPCPECGKTVKASRRFIVNTVLGKDAARLVQRGCRIVGRSALAKTFVPFIVLAGGLLLPADIVFSQTLTVILAILVAVWLLIDAIAWWLAVTPPRGAPVFWAGPLAWASRVGGVASVILMIWAAYEEFVRLNAWSSNSTILFILGVAMWWLRNTAGVWAIRGLLARVYPWRTNCAGHAGVTLLALGSIGGIVCADALVMTGGLLTSLFSLVSMPLTCLAWAFTAATMVNMADLLVFEWAAHEASSADEVS